MKKRIQLLEGVSKPLLNDSPSRLVQENTTRRVVQLCFLPVLKPVLITRQQPVDPGITNEALTVGATSAGFQQ